MSEGTIVGGWGYVIAAYSITALGLAGYAWSLLRRRRRAKKHEEFDQ